MDLTFINGQAEFRVDTHFNLHIEGGRDVVLYRRTSGERWDIVGRLMGNIIDIDVAVTLPKDYRVTCTAAPTMVVVTFKEKEE